MRKIFLLTIFLSLLVSRTEAQAVPPPANKPAPPVNQNEPKPPYLEDKILPSFKVLKTDSVTVFNTSDIPTGRKIVMIFFDPHCSHCITFLQKLFPAMDSFKNVDFYLMTFMHEMTQIRKFCDDYNIKQYKNIKLVGRDMDFFFIPHYGVRNFPGVAIYDKHKKFVHLFESDATKVEDIYEYTHP